MLFRHNCEIRTKPTIGRIPLNSSPEDLANTLINKNCGTKNIYNQIKQTLNVENHLKSIGEGQNHIEPTPPMYSLHNLHVQVSGFHTIIFDLKTDRVSEFLISFGEEFHIIDPKYLNEFSLYKKATVLPGSTHTKVQLNLDLQKLWYKKHIQSDKTNTKCRKSFIN